MAREDPKGSPGLHDPDGQPLDLLLAQERATSADFAGKVRRRIHRRATAANLASFSWHLPKVILLEIAGLLRHFVASASGKKGSQP